MFQYLSPCRPRFNRPSLPFHRSREQRLAALSTSICKTSQANGRFIPVIQREVRVDLRRLPFQYLAMSAVYQQPPRWRKRFP